MKAAKLIFEGSTAGSISVPFVVDEAPGHFALEVINNSTADLTLTIGASLDKSNPTYSKYIDPATDAAIVFTVPAGERHLRTFAQGAYPFYYVLTGTLGSGTTPTYIYASN